MVSFLLWKGGYKDPALCKTQEFVFILSTFCLYRCRVQEAKRNCRYVHILRMSSISTVYFVLGMKDVPNVVVWTKNRCVGRTAQVMNRQLHK